MAESSAPRSDAFPRTQADAARPAPGRADGAPPGTAPPDTARSGASAPARHAAAPDRQQRLLPLAVWAVIGLGVFFFLVTLSQLTYLHWELRKPQASQVAAYARQVLETAEPGDVTQLQLALSAQLESEAIARRYDGASVILMGHLWIRYLGFITGMIMAVIGSTFILARVRAPGQSQLGAEGGGVKLTLASASPGLILAALGSVMMVVTVLAQQTTNVSDSALYRPFALPGAGPSRPFEPPATLPNAPAAEQPDAATRVRPPRALRPAAPGPSASEETPAGAAPPAQEQ